MDTKQKIKSQTTQEEATKQQQETRPMRQIAKDSQVNILEKILELQKDGIDL